MRKTTLQFKIVATICALWLFGSTALILISSRKIRIVLDDSIRTRLSDYASLGSSMISAESHAVLQTRDDESRPEYREIVAVLRRLKSYNPHISFAYTVRKTPGGDIVFVVDGEEAEENLSHLADAYDDAGPLLREIAGNLRSTVVEKDVYRDQWGTFLSSYAPILRPDGTLEAVLCVDMDVESINGIMRAYVLLVVVLMFGSFSSSCPHRPFCPAI